MIIDGMFIEVDKINEKTIAIIILNTHMIVQS
jgi:hypothetical protein